MYGPDLIKTFVLAIGGEEWPVSTTDHEHTFSCATLREAMQDVLRETTRGIPCRIVATKAWETKYGALPRHVGGTAPWEPVA